MRTSIVFFCVACFKVLDLGGAYAAKPEVTKAEPPKRDEQPADRTPFRTIAHEILALEESACGTSSEKRKMLLDEVIDAAVAEYGKSRGKISTLPVRDQAAKSLELFEHVFQRFHFVYPAVGYVGSLRDGLMPVNLDDKNLRRIDETDENHMRRSMIFNSPKAEFHIADCDILSILYVAIGEELKLPIAMVDLPEPPNGVGHNYVTWTLPDGSRINWEAMSGTERFSDRRDPPFFFGSPQTLAQATKARAFAVPMSRDETLAYWHLIVASTWAHSGSYDKALASQRLAMRMNPACPKAYNEAAWLLATSADPTVRNAAEAVTIAEKLLKLWPSANHLDTIAAAYAAAGKWKDAKTIQQRAIDTAAAYDPKAEGFRKRLAMYVNGEVYLAPRREEQEAENWRETLHNSRWRSPE